MARCADKLGIDLPIFGTEHEVIIPRLGVPDGTGETFLRHIYLGHSSDYGISTLGEVLARTDEVLEHTAKQCGALVVPHQWALKRTGTTSVASDLLPRGLSLVAEVDNVAESYFLTGTHLQTMRDFISSGLYDKGVGGFKWGDFDERQFMYGTSRTHTNPCLLLVDIEPAIYKI